MKRSLIYSAVLLHVVHQQAEAQNKVVAAADSLLSAVTIKWYAHPLVSTEGFVVYRQTKPSQEWARINAVPVSYRQHTVSANGHLLDPNLAGYISMASDTANIRGIALLAIAIKSFSSEPLAKFLGITLRDSALASGVTCRYKVTRLQDQQEIEVGESGWVKTGRFISEKSPQGLKAEVKRRNIRLTWKPDPMRYYGVHILRKINDTGSYRQITKDPVLVSQTGEGTATAEQGFFFEDRGLPQRSDISYFLRGVDLFGRYTEPCTPVIVVTGDGEPPAAVDSIKKQVSGRSVSLRWYKAAKEDDLAGYFIYRTTKSDTDFRQLNRKILHPDSFSFTDKAPAFGQYFYVVSAVDKSGNSRPSSPLFVDVYDNEPPAAPRGVSITGDSVSVNIRWKHNTENDCAGYLLYRTINGDYAETYVKITPQPVSCCVFRDTMPANIRNRILYKMVAVDESMNKSAYSQPASVILPDRSPPSRPFLTKGSLQSDGARAMQWFANPEPDLRVYEVWMKPLIDSLGTGTRIAETVNASFTDIRSKSAGAYGYWIVAKDSAGNRSMPSNTVYIRIPHKEEVVGSVPLLSAVYHEQKREVRLSWDGDWKNLRGFILFRKADGGNYLSVSQLIKSRSLKDLNLQAANTYEYQVRAYMLSGDVVRSNPVTIIIPEENEKN